MELYRVIDIYDIDAPGATVASYGLAFSCLDERCSYSYIATPIKNIRGKCKYMIEIGDTVLLKPYEFYDCVAGQIKIIKIIDGKNLIARMVKSLYNETS